MNPVKDVRRVRSTIVKAIRELPYNFLVNINPLGFLSLLGLGDKILSANEQGWFAGGCVPTSFWQATKRAGHGFVTKTVPLGGAFSDTLDAEHKGA